MPGIPFKDQPLLGLRFLVVEDEPLLAMLIVDMIEDLGGTVATVAYRVEPALNAIKEMEIDCATLDINLAGELSFPVAALLEKAEIPYTFCTAYSDAIAYPKIFSAPLIKKPFDLDIFRRVILSLVSVDRHS